MPALRKVVDFGTCVDYLSCTTYDKSLSESWYRHFWAYHTSIREADLPEPAEKQRRRGFDGVYTSGFFWGVDKGGLCLVQLSGQASDYCWSGMLTGSLPPKGKNLSTLMPRVSNITRVDLAVTISLEKCYKSLALDHYDKAGRGVNKQRKYAIYRNSKGGQTLYVGSSQSEMMGRVYDRAKESGVDVGYVWRYEVQVRKPKALPVTSELLQKFVESDRGVRQLISEYVWQWFKLRGVSPHFRARGNAPGSTVELKATTSRQKLHWLSTQVQPTVQKLARLGMLPEVIEALGLDNPVLAHYTVQRDFANYIAGRLELVEEKLG